MAETSTSPGKLVSVEGLNGVGKTYLTGRVVDTLSTRGQRPPLVLEEFSRRHIDAESDVGRRLLKTLVSASGGERFLRGGLPRSETLLLLAVKMHDYETIVAELGAGRTVVEGRSIHSTAVYQSLILHPDDDAAAFETANCILDMAAGWRPLPDVTIMLTDDVTAAVGRAEQRNGEPFTAEQWRMHRRAASLFERLVETDLEHIRVLDRRESEADTLVEAIIDAIAAAPARPYCGVVPRLPDAGSGHG
jgi:dTMP kinase